ncbi:MAG: hypothetical protein OXF74_02230 [Rhodobacteraceae bacterium]|nr:hypothetical protein [Paracoccaceae bacterium]
MPVIRVRPFVQRTALRTVLSGVTDPVSAKRLPVMIAAQDRAIAAYERDIEALITGDAAHSRSYRSPASAR